MLFGDTGRIYGRTKDDYFRIVSLSLTACLIAFLVNGLTESSLYYSAVAVVFWFIAGLSQGVKKINSILAVRNDRFGEFLLNIPAFQGLKAEYPVARLTLAVDNCVYELAKRLPFVDELLIWENRRHSLSEILKFSRELKKKKYDACLIFNPSKEFNLVSWLAGIPCGQAMTGNAPSCSIAG